MIKAANGNGNNFIIVADRFTSVVLAPPRFQKAGRFTRALQKDGME